MHKLQQQQQPTTNQLFFTTQRFTTPAKQSETTDSDDQQQQQQQQQHSSSPSSSSSSTTKKNTPQSNQKKHHQQHSTPKISKNPHIYGWKEKQTDAETSLITAETPMQHKNREFRRGKSKPQDPLTITKLSAQSLQAFDSTPSRSRRGSRASSIGSGHEALPHPRIPPSTLCRHIRTDLPPAMRCRTLLSWSTQKAEELTYKTFNTNQIKTTRFILDELPKTILNSFHFNQSNNKQFNIKQSKLVSKLLKSTIKNFIKGICENQVEIHTNHIASKQQQQQQDDNDDEEEDIVDPTIDFDSLPIHPQDIKNEKKIKELEDWRTRMSYEDNARQYQLSRYGKLIEKLEQHQEEEEEEDQEGETRTKTKTISSSKRRKMSLSNGGSGGGIGQEEEDESTTTRIDTKKLIDRQSILEFGRLLRRKSTLSRSIDAFIEHGTDWRDLPSNVGMLTDNLNRIESKVYEISTTSRGLLETSTHKLNQLITKPSSSSSSSSSSSPSSSLTIVKGIGIGIGIRSLEAKMILSSSDNDHDSDNLDGIQLCLKSLNLFSPFDDFILLNNNHHNNLNNNIGKNGNRSSIGFNSSNGANGANGANRIGNGGNGKRDLLRAISRTSCLS